MATIYMLTIPSIHKSEYGAYIGNFWAGTMFFKWEGRTNTKRIIRWIIEKNDCKKWVIGKERGKGGYEHYQIRLETSNDTFDQWILMNVPFAHIEKASDTWEYERKEGKFWKSDDTPLILRQRFGLLNDTQLRVINTARTQNDREIDVWYDPKGSRGKTWLAKHIMETGQGLIVPRADMREPRQCCDFIYRRWRNGMKYIIFDIPRTYNVKTNGIYELIEEVKDGLIFSTKYEGGWINISGVRVIVFTNNKLDTDRLSWDRWRIHGSGGTGGPFVTLIGPPITPPYGGV